MTGSLTRQPLAGERLAELLSSIAEAADFASAAALLTERLAEVASAPRACLLVLSPELGTLDSAAWAGFDDAARPAVRASLDDLGHPLVVCALSLSPMVADGSGATRVGLPFERWVAVPFPQPHFRDASPVVTPRKAAELAAGSGASPVSELAARRRMIGHAPCGAIVLEAVPEPEVTARLAHAAMLAGPVLSRMLAVDQYRRAADRIEHQRTLLDAVIDALPDPIVITDAANDIVLRNRRAAHLLTVADGDSEGRRRAAEINGLLLGAFVAKGSPLPARGPRELSLIDPQNAAELLFEVFSRRLADPVLGGAHLSVLRDVTDLRHAAGELERQVHRARSAEQSARGERDRLNLILENVGDPIVVTDERSSIVLMNRQAEQLFCAAGSDEGTAATGENDAKFAAFISAFAVGPELARRERMRLVRPSGAGMTAEIPVEVVSGKILNERGEPLAIVSVLHDLTKQAENERLYDELKKFSGELERRIIEATADLADQNARLQWQARELEKANRLKSDFLANMSHELRTPINALIGYTALMLERIYGDINAQQEEGLHRIQASAQHLLTLINDVLDLAKIEAGKMPLHLENVSLGEVVREIAEQLEPLVRRKGLDLVCEVPPDGIAMHTDRTKVKQILLNIVSNAVKFTQAGRVVVRAAREGDTVQIDVTDTGIGIRPKDLGAIWEDFRQVDQSRTREFGGTGLGLSITRKLVDALGGQVGVASEYGKGSTFTVRLSARVAAAQSPPLPLTAPPAPVD